MKKKMHMHSANTPMPKTYVGGLDLGARLGGGSCLNLGGLPARQACTRTLIVGAINTAIRKVVRGQGIRGWLHMTNRVAHQQAVSLLPLRHTLLTVRAFVIDVPRR
jgi:hypothetical protein